MMTHNPKFQTVVSDGFQPGALAKERVRAALHQKLRPAPRHYQWALAVGSLLVLLGISFYVHEPQQVRLLGPTALYASNSYVAQNFGECGPRGLETQTDYIHFQ